ncbi:hypothetical protein CBR_g36944 [Chara braunii]|uniref:Uncharacterized protein n=1 Tax=Chara braunii TaxID=69332 RepID=A0A388JZI1_CHABU|nr:hypothetical protein CBR_g36944 [Chara braunii]|eukprot:GBG63175.1 hypothetical protein CBR_g36944 [Chara braunii]
MGSLSSCSSSSSIRAGLVSSATSLNSDMCSISVSGGQSGRSASQPPASGPAEQIPNLMDEMPSVSSSYAPVPNLMDDIDMVLSDPSGSQVTQDDSTDEGIDIDTPSGFGVGEFALSGMNIPYDSEPEPLESRALSDGCHSQNGAKGLNQKENGSHTPLIGLLHPIRRNSRGKWRSGAIRQPAPGSPTPPLLSVDVELPSGGCILEDGALGFGGDGCVLMSIPGAKKKTVRVAVGENPYLKADDLVQGTIREESRGGGLVQWTQQRLAASKMLLSSGLRYVDGLVGDYHLRGMSSEMASPKVAAESSANDESDLTDEENESVQSIVGHRSLNGIKTSEEADHCRAQSRMLWLALAQQIADRMRTMAVADATVRALQKRWNQLENGWRVQV